MGWHGGGGGADPRVLHWLPVRGEPPADPLTPFARNSSPAARASLERYRRPSEEGSPPCPLVSPTLEGWCWCPNSPWGHPRWHPCIHHAGTHARAAPAAHGGTPVTSPWHTRVAAPLAPATDRHGRAVCGTPGSSPQPGAGMGGGGAGADVPPCPHTGPTVPPAPRWHVPAQNPRRLAGAGGVTRTRCPCTHPHGRGDWSRGPGAGGGGGGSRHPLSCHLHPVPTPPILPPAQLPAVCGGGCGGEGGAGSCSPQDGWVELNPICFIIGHKARSPGCSPAG